MQGAHVARRRALNQRTTAEDRPRVRHPADQRLVFSRHEDHAIARSTPRGLGRKLGANKRPRLTRKTGATQAMPVRDAAPGTRGTPNLSTRPASDGTDTHGFMQTMSLPS
ncbi:hypothetical protein GCM10010121_099880 [Streptomyces brasiliensis]|uniref:Uncharacterized protein n=1 Tax=Streptomyces brasiliensis TaxID=1954 RepID=A0A917UPW7_9ACTN|nr:hypothetical protein GCM10010121_099880 [Streptomyces brasiliensis]